MGVTPLGPHGLIVVRGPIGIGKTHFVRRATQPASTVWITLRNHRHSTELAAQLDRNLRTRLTTLPAELASAVGPSCGPSADADPMGRAEQLGALIGGALGATLERELVLVLDELERIDDAPGPVRLVESLVRSAPPQLIVVLVTRTDVPFSVARLRQEGRLTEIGPESLTIDDQAAAALVGEIWPDADADCTQELLAASAGNAGALRAATNLMARLAPADRTDAVRRIAAADPDVATAAIAALVHALDPHARRLIDDLVVLGEISVAELAEFGHGADALLLAELADAGLFDRKPGSSSRYQPTRTVLGLVAPRAGADPGRAEGAVRLAVARGDPRRGLSAALDYGDAELLVRTVSELAAGVIDSGHAQLVLDAIESLPADRVAGLHGLAGRAAQALGDWERAAWEYELAAMVEVRAADAWRHGLIVYLQGRNADARQIYQRALDAFSDCGRAAAEPVADRALLAGYAGAAAWTIGDLEHARALAAQALTLATGARDDRALSVAFTTAALVAASDGDRVANDWNYVRALQHAERAGDALQIARIRSNRGSRLMEEGEFEEALIELDLAVRHADLGGYGVMLALALSNRGEVRVKLGRLDEARTDLTTAVDLLQRQGSGLVAYPMAALARLFVVRGDMQQALGAGERALALGEAVGDQQITTAARVHLAHALASREPEAARHHAEQAVEATSSLDLAEAWCAVARLAHDRGDCEASVDAVKRSVELARARRDRWALGQAIEVGGGLEPNLREKRALLEEALGLFRELGCVIDSARVELGLAELDRPEVAIPRMTAVADLARRLGARPLAAAADERLAQLATSESAPLHVIALGAFGLVRDGEPLPSAAWQSKKARDLFRMLVTRRGRPLSRELAIERIWPDDAADDASKASSKLSVALATIRAVLDPDKVHQSDHFLQADSESIRLDTTAVSIDVERFLSAAKSAVQQHREGSGETATAMLAAAEAAYTGDVFEDDPYADWHVPLREEARSAYLTVAKALADRRAAAGDSDDAVRLLLRVLEREPYDEGAHLQLVALLGGAGRHGDARRRYQHYADRMRELDLEPRSFPVMA